RKFSSILVPQLTKLEMLPVLDKIRGVHIRVAESSRNGSCNREHTLRNCLKFTPIEFDILSLDDGCSILSASLFSDELVIHEGQKDIVEISLNVYDSMHNHVAQIKHPISGMKVYELNESSDAELGIRSCIEGNEVCPLEKRCHHGLFIQCRSTGCCYAKSKWEMKTLGGSIANISPKSSFFSGTSVTASWESGVDNESRLVALSTALVQLIREGSPALVQTIKNCHVRHG
ncbi:hypothetical protein PMAYCL1PPCAC_26325, partial [Pristionchus mayeri]